jgi:peroxiredoxin
MKHTLSLFWAFFLLFAASSASALPASGEKAPAFTLPTTGGNASLSDYAGKWVVLEWFNPNCPFVKKFYGPGHMQKWQKEWTEKGVSWLLVSSSHAGHPDHVAVADIPAVLERLKIDSAKLLIDETGAVGRAYGATNTPQVFLISPEGVIVYQGAVDDRRTSDPADVPLAKNFLLQALRQATSGEKVELSATRPYGCSVKYAAK